MSLWGEIFTENEVSDSEIRKKVNKYSPKLKTSSEDKLKKVYDDVNRILGVYKESTICIHSKAELHRYIDSAIKNGIISIDTETNHSLEPTTGKVVGPCIYTFGEKNAYIPILHRDSESQTLLDNQVSADDIKEEFERLKNTFIVMHNAKFDIQFIHFNYGIRLHCDWDTLLAARLLNENEEAKLKNQYILHIDNSIEKYSIGKLFDNIPYEDIPPELFALYAATDAFMTLKLQQFQKSLFELPFNKRLYDLFLNVEMPIVDVVVDMEETGVCIDTEYASRLSKKYHLLLENVDKKIEIELSKYSDTIAKWRLTEEANKKSPKTYTGESIHSAAFQKKRSAGEVYYDKTKELWVSNKEFTKSKSEQLSDPVLLSSPIQVAIFFYDVLKCPVIDKDSPRGTGEDILAKMDYPICKLIIEKKGYEKLLSTFIDKLPKCLSTFDNRLHTNFHSLGTVTGRFSSTDPNLQNIPSHNNEIRMMFVPSNYEQTLNKENNKYSLTDAQEILTNKGWKFADEISVGDVLLSDTYKEVVTLVNILNRTVEIETTECGYAD